MGGVNELGAFFAVSALVIVTPGQDTALTIRNTLAGGRRAGMFTAIGVATGQATWTLASSVGLTALLIASKPAFTAVRFAGAAYLAWLGARSLIGALRPERAGPMPATPRDASPLAPSVALRQGVVSALGNPKLAVFFVSLLPQFVPRDRASLPLLIGLGATFCVMTSVWLTGYAVVVGKARSLLRRSWLRRALEGALGATLVALGFRVATERP